MDKIEEEYAHLSEEHRAFLKRALSGKFDQGANGFDLTMFRANLRLTPTERIEKLQRALPLFREVRRAGREHRLSRSNKPPR